MWVLDRLDPGRATYNVPWAVWLDGPLDLTALTGAWAAAVGRHEALRTVFRDDSGVPVQVVDDEPGPAGRLPVSFLPGSPPAAEDQARELLRQLAQTPFDLAAGPLVRATLLRLAPDRHVLSLVAHHIVADGWSVRTLFGELIADYQALRGGGPVAPAPRLQYADFALWQGEHAEAGGYADAEAFWRAELAGAPSELALPADHAYPEIEHDAAATVAVEIAVPVAAGLRDLAASLGVTVFAVLAAGYAALLARLTGADDLLIAVPVAARTQAETEPVIGLFANTLAIRADLTGNPGLGQLATRLHAANARAQPHQELPFARVVELISPPRRRSRSPLVQATCSVDEGWPVCSAGGLTWRPELTDNGTGKFELELNVTDRGGPGPDGDGRTGLDGRLRYRTDLFERPTAGRFADGLTAVLATMAAEPGTRLSDVDILTPEGRELVTRRWPAGGELPAAGTVEADLAVPGPLTLAVAACARDEIVVSGSDGQLTGPRLRDLAEAIGARLTALGAGVQDTVGILLPRGSRMLAALLGAWWAGTVFVPIDPLQPARRIRSFLADAGVKAVISDRTALGPLLAETAAGLPVIDLAGPPDSGIPAPGRLAAPRQLPAEAAAYVLFTSGSTGRPKGVTVTHGSLGYLLRAFSQLVPLRPGDRFTAVTSFGFDISILELLLPLVTGAHVTVADADQARDGIALARLLAADGTTALQATPATWRLLTAAGGVPPQVRLRLCGGEPLPRDLADELAGGQARLWNVYGPTETTVWSTAGLVAAGKRTIDVGVAIAGTRCYVLDRWDNPVPPGVTGEVCIGGAGVARGYLAAPGLTAARFRPDPFGAEGSRLYQTGDLGRWLPSGRLELLGRADRQLKIRGFRVEAGEVEAALRAHPDVADAVVTAVTDPGSAGLQLVGYVVTSLSEPAGLLREHLRGELPDYLIPSAFVALAGLPRTASGKIDYRSLPAPETSLAPAGRSVAPRTPLERELAGLFATVLRRSGEVGALDNFFVLGGHSLTATQVMAGVWTSYGVDLPVRTLFDDPTVAGLAAAITAAGADSGGGLSPDESQRTGAERLGGAPPDFADFLAELSDADIDDLLRDA
jgi:amino acid adenylation domain-containing protein